MSIQFVDFRSQANSPLSATQDVTFLEGSTSHSIQEVVFWDRPKNVSPPNGYTLKEDSAEHTKSFLNTWFPCFYKA